MHTCITHAQHDVTRVCISFAQTGMPNFYLDFLLFLSTKNHRSITLEQMTIKHLIYTKSIPFNGTERDGVIFFQFSGRKVL